MEVRAKKALGQHFLTDQSVARSIVAALSVSDVQDTLEIGPGMGVLSQYLLAREDIRLKMVEVDGESVVYLRNHFPGIEGKLLQAWYDIEYVLSVGPGAFCPPPKVHSAVIRLKRNSRTDLGCDEKLFKQVVKTAFNQRRKTLRNALKPLTKEGQDTSDPIFDLRAEKLSVEEFVYLTNLLS